ncbi:hypothetical protein HG263_00670 [Pseudoalteromonas sp. JBTF-M23]|uniref:Uncharacterized protein n=1 Tax=Pseudoalteromonas caenipelagi TaxID=2726988 RepID=A0A849V8V2_9GAMM|nr:hypothetical protein [Pseudoalteromonas caenipelagi]NOU49063.1 hypothetical protein [Pseudoalteromonas caenipelagi]
MKKISVLIALLLIVNSAHAKDISCSGKVSMLMAEHISCKDSSNKKQFAFKLEGTTSWKCSGSDTASSLLLAAKVAEKPLTIYMDDANGATCSTHNGYLKVSYIILY